MRLISKREKEAISAVDGKEVYGVRVGKNTIEAISHNGGVFAKITTKSPLDVGDYPLDEEKELELTQKWVIDGECLRKIKIKKSKHPVLESILLSTHDGEVALSTTDLETTARSYPKMCCFPDKELEECIPNTSPAAEVCMLKESVLSALRVFPAKAIIRVRVHGPDEGVELYHRGVEHETCVGVMPAKRR